jgi:hypothetical protein
MMFGSAQEAAAASLLPPAVPIEDGANMFITRFAFDLLRNPAFEAAAKAHVQKKLDQLRYPAYMQSLQVQSLHADPAGRRTARLFCHLLARLQGKKASVQLGAGARGCMHGTRGWPAGASSKWTVILSQEALDNQAHSLGPRL